MKKLLLLTAILIVFSLTLVSATGEKAASGKEPYKIGAVLDVTGSASSLGDPEKITLEMLVEEINAKGGINGHPLELILYDNEGDEAKSLTKVKRLIEADKVAAILGTSQSGTTMAIVPTVMAAQIPLVSCAASWKIIKDPETKETRKWIFKTPQSDSLAVSKIFEYCNKNKISKIAIITVSNGYGDSGRAELKRLAPEYKIEIVADERYGAADLDMKAQLTNIKGKDAQAVICWAVPQQGAGTVAKNAKELAMTQQIIMSHGVANKKFIDLAGDAAEGVVLPSGRLIVAEQLGAKDPQKKLLLDYRKKFEEKAKYPASTFGGHAYDALEILVNALKKAGTDPNKLRDELEKTKNFVGTAGVFNMSPTDHEGLTKDAFVMVKIEKGNWVLLK